MGTRALVAACFSAAGLIALAFCCGALPSTASPSGRKSAAPTLLQRHELSFAIVSLERHQGLPMERLVIEGRRHGATDADVTRGLAAVRSILDRRKPLIIHYDVRNAGMVLSWHQLWQGVNWARERTNAQLMDKHLQCISMIMRPGAVRAAISTIVNIMAPPQPTHIGGDEEGALRFAKAQCRHRKDWTAESAKRDAARARHEQSGARGSHEGNGAAAAGATANHHHGSATDEATGLFARLRTGLFTTLGARCTSMFSRTSA